MKVALIEGGQHFEVLRSYAFMLLHDGLSISIFTNAISHNYLKEILSNKVTWYIDDTNDFISFLIKNESEINANHIVICTSPRSLDGKFIYKTWLSKSYLVLHDLHNDFAPLRYLSIFHSWSLIDMLKTIKYLSSNYFITRKKALKSFDNVIVSSIPMQAYGLTKNFFEKSKILPFLWNEISSPITNNDFIKISIPGAIKQRSRDYNYCYMLFRRLLNDYNGPKIQLMILGNTKSKEAKTIVNKLKSLECKDFNVVSFENEICQKEFDNHLLHTDILLLPLQKRWQYGVVDEIGGITCVSGNIGDMVRFGLPAILPSDYNLPIDLEDLCFRLSFSELEADTLLVKEIIISKKYNILKSSASTILSLFNQSQSDKISEIINPID